MAACVAARAILVVCLFDRWMAACMLYCLLHYRLLATLFVFAPQLPVVGGGHFWKLSRIPIGQRI